MFLAPRRERPSSPASAASPSRSGAAPVPPPAASPNPHWSRLVQRDPVQVPHDDAGDRYQQAQQEIAAFRAGEPYSVRDFTPSTGKGLFDAMYVGSQMLASVRLKFEFYASPSWMWGDPDAPDPDWKDQKEKDDWKRDFRAEVAKKWNAQQYGLFCQKPGWEEVRALVKVGLFDVDDPNGLPGGMGLTAADQGPPHFTAEVYKVPKGRKYQSVVNSPNPALGRPRGTQALGSEDLVPHKDKTGKHEQRTGIHESGHYFGLGDSYVDPIKSSQKVSHADQAKKETGQTVPIADDGRLMSIGEKMDLTDAVTFLEAIRAATGIPEWSLKPTFPLGPPGPEPSHDMPAPKQAVV